MAYRDQARRDILLRSRLLFYRSACLFEFCRRATKLF
jgi:hypothetical protein